LKTKIVVGNLTEFSEKIPKMLGKVQNTFPSQRDGWVNYEKEMELSSEKFEGEKTKSSDPLLIYFTSGTTGNPKMVLHTHAYPIGHTVTAKFVHDLKKDDVHWTVADTGWAKTAWGKLFGQWICGATVVQHNVKGRFSAANTLKIMEKYGITTFCVPPTIYRMLLLEDLSKYDLSKLRHCCSAGEPLNPDVINQWEKSTGIKILDFFGQTETVALLGNFRCMPMKPGSVGKPTPGHYVSIVDDDGNELPPDAEGHIAVKTESRPPGLFKEYWKDPEKNNEVFKKKWYYTGDKGYRDKDGYFWFVGRSDDVIKASGYRIGPFEVESALIEHPSVTEAAVIGSPDPVRGLIVKAFIILAPGYEPSEKLTKDLQEHVKKVTAPYKYPREIEYVKTLPKTISGKIKRKELREAEFRKKH
jgi:acyl-coenzyme A synthetase/AMP-(fatty) acid ligase